MKTTLTILTATVMPGGFVILAVAFAGYLLARNQKQLAQLAPRA